MPSFRIVCFIIGVSQIVLGTLFLVVPGMMYQTMGIPVPSAGYDYVSAMLAARFLVYGVALFLASRQPREFRLWLDGMLVIQAIDLAGGLFYSSTGAVPWSASAFPMINAALFIAALLWKRPLWAEKAAHA